jgi:penicillin-binding protein 1C
VRRLFTRRVFKRSALTLAAVGAVSVVAFAAWVLTPLPDGLTSPPEGAGIRITDRYGTLLRSTRGEDGARGRWIPFEQIDPDLIVAFVAVEDRRFWDHSGVDVRAVLRAARDNLAAGKIVSGASTLTMQLARLLDPGARGWRSKFRETAWAFRLDWHLEKQEILEQYLNRVHLGQSTVGVGAAAAFYMGASADELSVGEAAMLAGLAHAPSRDNPVTSAKRAARRRSVALDRMVATGAIAFEQASRARREPALTRRSRDPFLAPHFTTRLLAANRAREEESVVLRTTLDAGLQAELESEVRQTVEQLAGRGVKEAAAVVIENETGAVRAWVGSPDFFEPRNGQTDLVTSMRQPGSALKPFLYAMAFDQGLTAASVLADVPTAFPTISGPYEPRNYDRRFHGPVRAREALASSYNVPAVLLAERVGTGPFLHTLHLAGFHSLRRSADHYGLGLALGNGDVTLIELANGYRALANGGVYSNWRWDASRDDASPGDGRRVVSARAAALTLDVLADPAARIPGFGVRTPFDFPFPTAVKTGTSRHFTDNWAVAVTGGFTVAVWAGDVTGRPMEGVSGVTGAGPLLHRAVLLTAARYAPGQLPSLDALGLERVDVCAVSGMLPTRECPGTREWFVPGTAPTERDTWVRGGRVMLPAQYAAWTTQAGARFESSAEDELVAMDEIAVPLREDEPTPRGFRIVSPADGDVYRMPPGVPNDYATLALRAAGERGVVRWFINGAPFAESRWRLRSGAHTIRAVAANGAVSEVRIRVE